MIFSLPLQDLSYHNTSHEKIFRVDVLSLRIDYVSGIGLIIMCLSFCHPYNVLLSAGHELVIANLAYILHGSGLNY